MAKGKSTLIQSIKIALFGGSDAQPSYSPEYHFEDRMRDAQERFNTAMEMGGGEILGMENNGEVKIRLTGADWPGAREFSFDPRNPEDMWTASNVLQRSATTRAFDFGNGVEGRTQVIDGLKTTFLENRFGSHAEVEREGYELQPQKNGAMRYTNEASGSSYESMKTKGGHFFDISSYQPVDGSGFGTSLLSERSHRYTGSVNFTFGADGKMSYITQGKIPANSILIKAPDGGIRTIDKNGDLVLADLSDRKLAKQGISKEDIAAHRQFADQAKDNPARVEQGFSVKRSFLSPAQRQEAESLNSIPIFERAMMELKARNAVGGQPDDKGPQAPSGEDRVRSKSAAAVVANSLRAALEESAQETPEKSEQQTAAAKRGSAQR